MPILKCLESAGANAENNDNLLKDNLYVAECYAMNGPTLKRMIPKAKGSAGKILKRSSHIKIVLLEKGTKKEDSKGKKRGVKEESKKEVVKEKDKKEVVKDKKEVVKVNEKKEVIKEKKEIKQEVKKVKTVAEKPITDKPQTDKPLGTKPIIKKKAAAKPATKKEKN
jgi:large subunit ribosomal protein L22